MKENTQLVPYYIGDLCYVLDEEAWLEVCDQTPFDNSQSEFVLSDGRKYYLLSTAHGDGTYLDLFGHAYYVDSGTLGAILLSDLPEPHDLDRLNRLGNIVSCNPDEFCAYAEEEYGILNFGPISIQTDFPDEMVPDGVW